jgi:hypothetical protein
VTWVGMLTAASSLDRLIARCNASAGASGGGLLDRSRYSGLSLSTEPWSLDVLRPVRGRMSSL